MSDDTKERKLAIATRLKLGLQSTEYCDIYRAICALRITCIKRPLESGISGATLKTRRAKVILVNSRKSLGHQNFTVAHEIYHCLYDPNLESRACNIGPSGSGPSVELAADKFAKHLLMPEDAIYYHLGIRGRSDSPIVLADIISLEQFFGVSRRAMCWRLEELGKITRQDSDQYCQNVKQSARVLGKNTGLYEATNEKTIISDYVERAKEALVKDLITDARYEEILADAGVLEEVMGAANEEDVVD